MHAPAGWPRREPLNRAQYVLLVLASFVGLGIFTYPGDLVLADPLSGWTALAMVLGLSAVGLWAALAVSRRLPRATMPTATAAAVGPWLAPALVVAGTLTDFLLSAFVLRQLTELVATSFLIRTPRLLIATTAMAAAWYASVPGLPVLARALPGVFAVVMAMALVSEGLALQNLHFAWLVAPHALHLAGGAAGAMTALYIGLGFHPVTNLHAHASPLRGASRDTWIAFGLVGLLLAASLGVVLGTFSPWAARELTAPLAFALRLIEVPGFYVSRFGLFELAGWTAVVVTYLGVHAWSQAVCLGDTLNLGRPAQAWLMTGLSVLTVGVGVYAFPTPLALHDFVVRLLNPLALVTLIGAPAVVAVVARLRLGTAARLRPRPT